MTQTVTVTQASIADLIEQRDELLEALKECAEALECERSRHSLHIGKEAEDVGARAALKAADAAIAKASPIAGLTEIGEEETGFRPESPSAAAEPRSSALAPIAMQSGKVG